MSWLHRHDLCRLIATALDDGSYSGVYNAVSPQPTTMGAFADALVRAQPAAGARAGAAAAAR